MGKIFLAAILACIAAPAQAAPLTLECRDSLADGAGEQRQIKALGQGVVSRPSADVLRVTVLGTALTFRDEAPDDDEMRFVRYRFCDRKDGFILIGHSSFDVATGKLINEATGKVTPAGYRVVLSPDRRAYFAAEQPDGLDGNVWLIHALDGRQSWSGFNYIPHAQDTGRMTAYLADAAWEPDGRFSAQAQCVFQRTTEWKVTLTNHGGKWDWRPKRACPSR